MALYMRKMPRWLAVAALGLVTGAALPAAAPARTAYTFGGLTWSIPKQIDFGIPAYHPNNTMAVSCSSSSFCVAVDGFGNALVSTYPSVPGRWKPSNIDGSNVLSSVSCPTRSLCVAVDTVGNVLTSTAPKSGAASWTASSLDPANAFTSVSCASASLCVAVDTAGQAFTSTNPTGGTLAWTGVHIDGVTPLWGVSCPSASLCVAVDDVGVAIVSTDPTGGAGAWLTTAIDSGVPLDAVSCPSTTMCVVGAADGVLFYSLNPTNHAWHGDPDYLDERGAITAVSCASRTFCVAVDSVGNVLTPWGSTITTSWRSHIEDYVATPVGVSCPAVALCVAVDLDGYLLTGVKRPVVSTGSAGSVTAHGAALKGAVNPNGLPTSACYFLIRVGTTSKKAACKHSPGAGSRSVAVSARVRGLVAGKKYAYKLVATTLGGTTVGRAKLFTTTRN